VGEQQFGGGVLAAVAGRPQCAVDVPRCGFQTNPNLGSCMDYTRDPDGPPSNEHPNSHDYSLLVSIYSHTDGFSTTGVDSRTLSVVGNAPSSWGRMVSGSRASGASATYLRKVGTELVVTVVTWA
jgi:hypothetical protein